MVLLQTDHQGIKNDTPLSPSQSFPILPLHSTFMVFLLRVVVASNGCIVSSRKEKKEGHLHFIISVHALDVCGCIVFLLGHAYTHTVIVYFMYFIGNVNSRPSRPYLNYFLEVSTV